MNAIGGVILMAIGGVLLFFGRARGGAPRSFLHIYIVGQLYLLTTMVFIVLGAAVVISNWPF
jgi:hypothetical protein